MIVSGVEHTEKGGIIFRVEGRELKNAQRQNNVQHLVSTDRKIKCKVVFMARHVEKELHYSHIIKKMYVGNIKEFRLSPKNHGKILKYFKQKVTLAELTLSPILPIVPAFQH